MPYSTEYPYVMELAHFRTWETFLNETDVEDAMSESLIGRDGSVVVHLPRGVVTSSTRTDPKG